MRDNGALSERDRVFGAIAAFSGLYCFAVSFSLKLPTGRERCLIALAVLAVSFSFIKQKKGVALGVLAFIALRFVWAGILLLFQH
jgi:hypothetical protein